MHCRTMAMNQNASLIGIYIVDKQGLHLVCLLSSFVQQLLCRWIVFLWLQDNSSGLTKVTCEAAGMFSASLSRGPTDLAAEERCPGE